MKADATADGTHTDRIRTDQTDQQWSCGILLETQQRLVAQRLASINQIGIRNFHARLQLIMKAALVAVFFAEEIVRKEIQWKDLEPGCLNALVNRPGFETVFYERDLTCAVVQEVRRDRRVANLFSIQQNQSTWRIRANHNSSMHTTSECKTRAAQQQQ